MMKTTTTTKLTNAANKIVKFHLEQLLNCRVGIQNAHESMLDEWRSTLRLPQNQALFENELGIGVKLSNVCKTKVQFDFLSNLINNMVSEKLALMKDVINR